MEDKTKKQGSFSRPNKSHKFEKRVPEEREFEEKTIDLRRVTRVTAGGKRFSFRVTMVVGDKKGRIGIGLAKGRDVAQSIAKAKAAAEKNVFRLPLVGNTIGHEVSAKYGAAKVILRPASAGHGLVAGGSVRVVCGLAGIKDISAKIVGTTTNKLNNARATLVALKKLRGRKVLVKN